MPQRNSTISSASAGALDHGRRVVREGAGIGGRLPT
jgi:hypothetical protein